MNLTEKVIDAIKDNLGELEIQAINELLRDRDNLVQANQTIEMQRQDLAESKKQYDALASKHHDLNTRNNETTDKLAELEAQISTYQEREVQLRVSEALIPLHQEYSDRAFGILRDSLRHYTQKTTRSLVVGGGEINTGTYDQNGVENTIKAMDTVQKVTDTQKTE